MYCPPILNIRDLAAKAARARYAMPGILEPACAGETHRQPSA
jgi:hypothetical protein